MKRMIVWMVAVLGLAGAGAGQELMSDVLAGKLINPEPGVYAWYDLKDAKTGDLYFMRQAIVGEEKVKQETAYWVETEIVPQVGFPAVYKMLLTGPASDPKHVHRLMMREGDGEVQEIPVDPDKPAERTKSALEDGERSSSGQEEVQTPQGAVKAEHLTITNQGEHTELWLNNDVRPMGVVRMVSPQGELNLRRYGKGGKDGESALLSTPAAAGTPGSEWRVETKAADNSKAEEKKEENAAPEPKGKREGKKQELKKAKEEKREKKKDEKGEKKEPVEEVKP